MLKMYVKMIVNGCEVEGFVELWILLIYFFWENLNIIGLYIGCEISYCGVCIVDIDGKLVKFCIVFVVQINGVDVIIVEGLVNVDGLLGVIQEMFCEYYGFQCGYCMLGMIICVYCLLQENLMLIEEEVWFGMVGNFCCCIGY